MESDTLTLQCGEASADFGYSSEWERDILWWMEEAERDLLRDMLAEVNPDDVVYDVGANIGVISCLVATKLIDGMVVAFEPYGPNTERLEANLARNLSAESYQVVKQALAATDGTIPFSVPEGSGPGTQTGHIDAENNAPAVSATSGDSFVRTGEVPSPNIVKIDVEGAEGQVIGGFEKTLSAPECRVVYVEGHLTKKDGTRPAMEAFGESPASLRSKLQSLGFEIVDQRHRGSELHIKATCDP